MSSATANVISANSNFRPLFMVGGEFRLGQVGDNQILPKLGERQSLLAQYQAQQWQEAQVYNNQAQLPRLTSSSEHLSLYL